ncbi:MAG: copper chaperone PCu(A)C [Steroidobacteraceae bacterium]
MNIRQGLRTAGLLWLLAAWPASAGDLTITGAWARSTAPGVGMGAIYLTIDNGSTKSDRLLKLSTPVAATAEVHRTEVLDGIVRMREVAVLHVAAGERIEFKPGGHHVMLMGLRKPLVEGQVFDLELVFEVSGPRKVRVVVRSGA